jgi:hypothetical protein
MDMEMAEHGLIIAQGKILGVLFSAVRVQKLRKKFPNYLATYPPDPLPLQGKGE